MGLLPAMDRERKEEQRLVLISTVINAQSIAEELWPFNYRIREPLIEFDIFEKLVSQVLKSPRSERIPPQKEAQPWRPRAPSNIWMHLILCAPVQRPVLSTQLCWAHSRWWRARRTQQPNGKRETLAWGALKNPPTHISPSLWWQFKVHRPKGLLWVKSISSCRPASLSSGVHTRDGKTPSGTTCLWTSVL